ncbi:zinc finger protein 624-like [Belonocnema kinseyi]|uniref:zinc finger protein 624-like n=1 Tax=Belonocnema kinseyi TaxID=2817044 RepID=UPI00143D892F|nr:zinc finger protein 624-like [Belonocnema kinseyi]
MKFMNQNRKQKKDTNVRNVQIKSESKKSTEMPYGWTYSCTTTDIFFDSSNTLIKYEIDDTLEIKQEIIPDQETVSGLKRNSEYGSTLSAVDIREVDISAVNKILLTPNKNEVQKSKQKAERKYKCDKCTRSYTQKKYLNSHQRFECGVMPQFRCMLCGKRFKLKSHVTRHVRGVHFKTPR